MHLIEIDKINQNQNQNPLIAEKAGEIARILRKVITVGQGKTDLYRSISSNLPKHKARFRKQIQNKKNHYALNVFD